MARKKFIIASGIALAAIAMGLLQLLPSVFLERAVRRSGHEFLITQMTHHGDATVFYLPAAREIIDGHFPPIDLHVPENRHTLFLRPPAPTLIFAALLRVANNENYTYMAAGFLFTVVMFLAFAWMGRVFFSSLPGGLLFAAVGVLTPAVFHLPRAFFSLELFADIIGKNFIPVVRTPIHQLFLARIEDPLLTLWLYIIVFTLLYLFFREPTARRAVILGVAMGLLLYFYLYYWLVAVVLFGFLAAYVLFVRREPHPAAWGLAFAIVVILAVPYLLNFWAFGHLPQAADLASRVGFEYGWGFRFSVWREYLAYAAFALAVLMLLRKRHHHAFVFSLSSLVAMVFLWNLQLFTGWNIQPDHWPKAFGLPLFILAALLLAEAASRLIEAGRSTVVRGALTAVLIILAVLLVAKKVANVYAFRDPPREWIAEYSFPKPILTSWRWLNENVGPEAVILTDSFVTSIYLTGYTSANPYLAFGSNTIAPNREVEERFLTVHKLFGTPPGRLSELLIYRKDLSAGCPPPCELHTALNLFKAPTYLYGQTFNAEQSVFDALTKDANYAIPPDAARALRTRYRNLNLRWEDFSGAWVYVGPWERELSDPDFRQNQNFELVYENELVEIYRIVKK